MLESQICDTIPCKIQIIGGINLLELFKIFSKIGATAFGGPLAHIAMVEKEVVERRKLISKEKFLDFIGSVNMIPGPNSTQIVMLCGLEYAGFWGMIVAGLSFIFPAVTITLILALFYDKFSSFQMIETAFSYLKYGIYPVIFLSILGFMKKSGKNSKLKGIILISAILEFLLKKEIFIILSVGILGVVFDKYLIKNKKINSLVLPLWFLVFEKFFKIGATLFGGGYMLIAYVTDEFVAKGLLSNTQLLDAIAMGQFTPGPILTSATFIGFQIAGVPGAIAGSLGIFLPSFILVFFLNKIVIKMRKNSSMSTFLEYVNCASIGVMSMVVLSLGLDLSKNLWGIPLLLLCWFLTEKKNLASYYLVGISFLYGIGVSFIR